MGLFDLFKGKNDPYGFRSFVTKNFITEDQYLKLVAFKQENKPHSKILNDFTPECLLSYVVMATQALYNHIYFKKSYFEYTGREPYWIAENMDDATRKKVHADHKAMLQCLKTAQLISPLTHDKLSGKLEEGVIYKVWELINIAATLSENEDAFKRLNMEAELRALQINGFINEKDTPHIRTDLTKGGINEWSELIAKFGNKISIPAQIKSTDPEKYLITTLDACLSALPFSRVHVIRSIEHIELIDPYHKDYKLKHTVITIDFNKKQYVFPFNVSDSYYRIATGFDALFFPAIVNFFCKEYGDQYHSFLLRDYFMDQPAGANGNITAYYFMATRKNFLPSAFLKHKLEAGIASTANSKEKEEFLSALFNLFDPGRISEEDRRFTYQNVNASAVSHVSKIPNYVPDLLHIEWYDNLSDNYTYHTILDHLSRISNGRFKPVNINDPSVTAGEDELFDVSMEVNAKRYQVTLKKGTVDYDIFRLVEQAQTDNDLGGKFYAYEEPFIQDGYSIIFLSDTEIERINNSTIFKVDPLNTVQNLWLEK